MAIGSGWPRAIRKAPAPEGVPGYIRIDTVHQGDRDGLKGVYHGPRPAPINAVDIVTQWELVASVEHISEAYLLPVITLLLEGFPFAIRGLHSDSGSEYVNHGPRPVASLPGGLGPGLPSRPCYFAVDIIDAKGKIRKTYPHDQIMTPWERLKIVTTYENYLKPGITIESLEHTANALSDNDAARHVQDARKRLFQTINRRSKSAA